MRFSPKMSVPVITSQGKSIAAGKEGTVAADSFRSLPALTRVEFDGVAPGDWADVYSHDLTHLEEEKSANDAGVAEVTGVAVAAVAKEAEEAAANGPTEAVCEPKLGSLMSQCIVSRAEHEAWDTQRMARGCAERLLTSGGVVASPWTVLLRRSDV